MVLDDDDDGIQQDRFDHIDFEPTQWINDALRRDYLHAILINKEEFDDSKSLVVEHQKSYLSVSRVRQELEKNVKLTRREMNKTYNATLIQHPKLHANIEQFEKAISRIRKTEQDLSLRVKEWSAKSKVVCTDVEQIIEVKQRLEQTFQVTKNLQQLYNAIENQVLPSLALIQKHWLELVAQDQNRSLDLPPSIPTSSQFSLNQQSIDFYEIAQVFISIGRKYKILLDSPPFQSERQQLESGLQQLVDCILIQLNIIRHYHLPLTYQNLLTLQILHSYDGSEKWKQKQHSASMIDHKEYLELWKQSADNLVQCWWQPVGLDESHDEDGQAQEAYGCWVNEFYQHLTKWLDTYLNMMSQMPSIKEKTLAKELLVTVHEKAKSLIIQALEQCKEIDISLILLNRTKQYAYHMKNKFLCLPIGLSKDEQHIDELTKMINKQVTGSSQPNEVAQLKDTMQDDQSEEHDIESPLKIKTQDIFHPHHNMVVSNDPTGGDLLRGEAQSLDRQYTNINDGEPSLLVFNGTSICTNSVISTKAAEEYVHSNPPSLSMFTVDEYLHHCQIIFSAFEYSQDNYIRLEQDAFIRFMNRMKITYPAMPSWWWDCMNVELHHHDHSIATTKITPTISLPSQSAITHEIPIKIGHTLPDLHNYQQQNLNRLDLVYEFQSLSEKILDYLERICIRTRDWPNRVTTMLYMHVERYINQFESSTTDLISHIRKEYHAIMVSRKWTNSHQDNDQDTMRDSLSNSVISSIHWTGLVNLELLSLLDSGSIKDSVDIPNLTEVEQQQLPQKSEGKNVNDHVHEIDEWDDSEFRLAYQWMQVAIKVQKRIQTLRQSIECNNGDFTTMNNPLNEQRLWWTTTTVPSQQRNNDPSGDQTSNQMVHSTFILDVLTIDPIQSSQYPAVVDHHETISDTQASSKCSTHSLPPSISSRLQYHANNSNFIIESQCLVLKTMFSFITLQIQSMMSSTLVDVNHPHNYDHDNLLLEKKVSSINIDSPQSVQNHPLHVLIDLDDENQWVKHRSSNPPTLTSSQNTSRPSPIELNQNEPQVYMKFIVEHFLVLLQLLEPLEEEGTLPALDSSFLGMISATKPNHGLHLDRLASQKDSNTLEGNAEQDVPPRGYHQKDSNSQDPLPRADQSTTQSPRVLIESNHQWSLVDHWTLVITYATQHLMIYSILRMTSITPDMSQQLATDLAHLFNILNLLHHPIDDYLVDLYQLLLQPHDENYTTYTRQLVRPEQKKTTILVSKCRNSFAMALQLIDTNPSNS